jgi:putative FmdB family regulatory protein
MPIYEYRCTKCEHQFEIYLKSHNESAGVCPKCNSDQLKKLVSACNGRVTDLQGIINRALSASREDIKALSRGDSKTIDDIAGTSPNSLKASKKLSEATSGAIKRRKSNI